MNRLLINVFPSWLVLTVFVAAGLVFAYGVYRLAYRYVAPKEDDENEVTVLSIELIGAVYGILLGFIIVALWENLNAADANVAHEATALAQVVRAAEAFSPDGRTLVVNAAGDYVRAVVDDEWQLMRDGATSERAADGISKLYAALQQYEPQTERQKVFYAEAVGRLGDVLSARRSRLEAVEASLSGSLRFMMYTGFAVIVTLLAVLGTGRRRAHVVMLLVVTGMIAFNLGLATTLDYPFSGDVSVSDEPFRLGVLAQFHR